MRYFVSAGIFFLLVVATSSHLVVRQDADAAPRPSTAPTSIPVQDDGSDGALAAGAAGAGAAAHQRMSGTISRRKRSGRWRRVVSPCLPAVRELHVLLVLVHGICVICAAQRRRLLLLLL